MTKKFLWLPLIILFIFTIPIPIHNVVGAPIARLYIDPVTSTASPGQSFTVNVKIERVKDLYTFVLKIRWNGPVLNAISITEGEFLGADGSRPTLFVPKIFNEEGDGGIPTPDRNYLIIGITLLAAYVGVDGSGTLATVTFEVESEGETALDIYLTELYNKPGRLITHQVEDGYFGVTPPKFSVVPTSIEDPFLVPGDYFTIDINISDVTNLRSFELKLSYNYSLLEATELGIMPFLNEPVDVHRSEINQTRGFIWVNVTSTAAEQVSGTGALVNVTFQILSVGESILDIYYARIIDQLSESIREHDVPTVDGYFSNKAVGRDIAVKKVIVIPTVAKVGEPVSINFTLVNAGLQNETFDVTAYYDGNAIETLENITLEAKGKKTRGITWDTSEVPSGTYTIKVEASEVPGEVNKANNKLTFTGKVTIKAKSGPNLILYAGIGIAAVVVVAVLLYFVKMRKPKGRITQSPG